jgi:hypothetical protein
MVSVEPILQEVAVIITAGKRMGVGDCRVFAWLAMVIQL